MTHCKLQLSLCNVLLHEMTVLRQLLFPVFCFSVVFNKTFTDLWSFMKNLDYFVFVHVLGTVHVCLLLQI